MTKIDNSNSKMDDNEPSDEEDDAAASPPGDGSASGALPDYKREQEGVSYPLFRFFDQSGTKHVVLSCEVPARRIPRVVTYHLFPSKGWSDGSKVTPADIAMIEQRLKERAEKAGFSHAHIDIHT
jgi:hypothetical protein